MCLIGIFLSGLGSLTRIGDLCCTYQAGCGGAVVPFNLPFAGCKHLNVIGALSILLFISICYYRFPNFFRPQLLYNTVLFLNPHVGMFYQKGELSRMDRGKQKGGSQRSKVLFHYYFFSVPTVSKLVQMRVMDSCPLVIPVVKIFSSHTYHLFTGKCHACFCLLVLVNFDLSMLVLLNR